ncbi:hypothetical protein [Actinocorallia sp. A-T 12471]|uniref:hypothetical protein n=1 Tax=Actinocorallia sp. A-T 12471 TaxID=3089813 RepID=UPI0029D0F1DD|nr:hypothetical protein [Actinocorallia sp. A-T 12471]MDX6741449.1 hypothetical protein [Actinocorallia sp. A-T 12471]
MAASDARVRSTVVLVPFAGLDTSDLGPEILGPEILGPEILGPEILGMFEDAALRQAAGQPPEMIAGTGKPGDHAVMTTVHAILATDDAITPASTARRALSPIEHLDIVEIPQTHFELFTVHLPETVDLTTRWFTDDLTSPQR